MDAKAILQRFDGLRTLRSNYEQTWEDIASVLRPLGKGFGSAKTEGAKRHTSIYDSTPLLALEHFKAGMFAAMTPPGSRWHELTHVDDDLNELGPVKEYLKVVNDRVWKSFGPGVSAFYNQVTSVYADLGAFGTGVMYSTEMRSRSRIVDRARALSECWLDTDEEDEVDTLFRRFDLTARAIAANAEWDVPEKIRKAAEKSPYEKHWIVHAVLPAPESAADRFGQRWLEMYVLEDGSHKLGEEGYFEFPYVAPRWDVAAGERYGRGCGHIALADIKSLNVARKSNLTLMDRAARPVILAQKETDLGGGIAPYPGEIVYGAINAEGRKLVSPMDEGKNTAVALNMEERLAAAIKDAFYFGLMQIVGSTNMTATEFLGRDDERQRLLGPYLGRLESEMLSPMIKRRVGILERAVQLPEMPRELVERNSGLEIRFVSPLARLQRQRDAESAARAVSAMLAAAQGAPQILDRIDADDLAEVFANGFGASILNTREVAQQIRDARDQQQETARAMEMAPQLAKMMKDAAGAGQVAAQTPFQMPAAANAA